MSKAIASGLRPDRKSMRLGSNRDRLHGSAARIDRIHNFIETSREPQKFAVCTDVAHVGTATAGYLPSIFNLMRREIDYRNAARPFWFSFTHVGAAIRHVQFLS